MFTQSTLSFNVFRVLRAAASNSSGSLQDGTNLHFTGKAKVLISTLETLFIRTELKDFKANAIKDCAD